MKKKAQTHWQESLKILLFTLKRVNYYDNKKFVMCFYQFRSNYVRRCCVVGKSCEMLAIFTFTLFSWCKKSLTILNMWDTVQVLTVTFKKQIWKKKTFNSHIIEVLAVEIWLSSLAIFDRSVSMKVNNLIFLRKLRHIIHITVHAVFHKLYEHDDFGKGQETTPTQYQNYI